MLKYKGRKVEVGEGGFLVRVIQEGKPLDGKYYFRNKEAQALFDELRNQSYLDDYWNVGDNFYFRFLSGETHHYTRREILRMAKGQDEECVTKDLKDLIIE